MVEESDCAERTGTKQGPGRHPKQNGPDEYPERIGMIQTPNGEWLFLLDAPPIPSKIRKITPMKFNRLMLSKQPNMNKVLEELTKMFGSFPIFPECVGAPTEELKALRFRIFFFEDKIDESGG